jgi:hypothetical protein
VDPFDRYRWTDEGELVRDQHAPGAREDAPSTDRHPPATDAATAPPVPVTAMPDLERSAIPKEPAFDFSDEEG